MNKDIFTERKNYLERLITNFLNEEKTNEQDRQSLHELLEILDSYSFENRLQQKGLLTHTIIDSLELDYSIGEKFIEFDNDIK